MLSMCYFCKNQNICKLADELLKREKDVENFLQSFSLGELELSCKLQNDFRVKDESVRKDMTRINPWN